MPLGKFGEVIGTMNTLGDRDVNYESKVIAPKNPKLIRERAPYVKLTPSEYLFKMSLDTQRKLQNTRVMELPQKLQLLDMANTTYQKNTAVSMEDPLFQPFPSSMFFVNCEPNETHELPLTLRNIDKVPRLVKVTLADSPYFRVIAPPNASHKVAAGLPIVFKIQFSPDHSRQDYHLNLVVVTEREKFLVPIHCIGSRAILDFPDQIIFAATPLKYNETKTILVRNIGNDVANFSIVTNGPFSVEPSSGILDINESMQLVMNFMPEEPREYNEEMVIQYETGEDVFVKVYGSGQEVSVRLERSLINVEETYVGLANLRNITLHNRSDVMVHFYWSNFASQVAEDLDRETFMKVLQLEEDEEKQKFQTDESLELMSSDKLSIVSRNFLNKKKLHQEKKSRFIDDIFTINPIEGDIWPHTSLDITVAFKPAEARTYQSFAFCEVTGRETRLSLKIAGVGVGPKVEFSFKTLDMGYLFIQAHHAYEVVLANKGDIDALFKIEGSGSAVSKCFTFTPDDGLISPGYHQVVQIHFHSKDFLGEFDEKFNVKMDGCIMPLVISFKGIVIGPTFNFNIHKLRFGEVSVGFPCSKEIILTNSSLVPLQYCLRVPTDGSVDPILASDLTIDQSPRDYCSKYQPREFSITPTRSTIEPMSSSTIIVTLTPNAIGKYHTALVVDVIGVGEDVFSLPLTASAVVPSVELSCEELDFSRCFLRYPYKRLVTMTNTSNLPIKYQLLQQVDHRDQLAYHSQADKAVVDAQSRHNIPIELTALRIGELSSVLKFKIFGSNKDSMNVYLRCIGEGPVVNISSIMLDWGTIKVLEDRVMSLVMSNESEIPAVFSANMLKDNSVYRIEPESGVLERHESLKLNVTANLNDCVKFTDELQIHIEDSKTKLIPLIATGSGTTVEFDPPLSAVMDLGAHFSNSLLQKVYRITNKGKRHQQLVWSNEGYSYTKAMRQTSDTKNPMQTPILTVFPHRFDLKPGESADLTLQGFVETPNVVHERILCHAIIGRQGGKELIKKVDFEVNFVSPIIQFSEKKLHFRIDKSLYNEFEILSKSITIQNVSGLSLNTKFEVSYPFSIVDPDPITSISMSSDRLIQKLDTEESKTLLIQFDPLYKTDFYSRIVEDFITISYDEHPHVDQIKLIGEVNFPNLDFDRQKIDFDCILNHSEVSQFVIMSNNSPLPVTYSWSILIGAGSNIVFHRKRPITPALEKDDNEKEIILDATDKDSGTEKYILVEDTDSPIKFNLEENTDIELGQIVNDFKLDLNFGEGDVDEVDTVIKVEQETKPQAKHLKFDKKVEEIKPKVNKKLKALLDQETEVVALGIEEVFDVTPLYGTLNPGEYSQITFTYFGHADVEAHATAICELEGGPTYQFQLNGEASTVEYRFSSLEFDFGEALYDQAVFQDMILTNNGKVGFEFTTKNASAILPNNQYPVAQPILNPISGFVPAGTSTTIKIGYFPGCPGKFLNSCKIQVGHFPMETVELCGQATYPRVTIDLPRDDGIFIDSSPYSFENMLNTHTLFGTEQTFETLFKNFKEESSKSGKSDMDDLTIYSYLEDLAVSNQPKKWDHSSNAKNLQRKSIDKPSLPAYCLDFGNVILGQVQPKEIRAVNTGKFTISMKCIKNTMQQSGFFMDLHQVNNLVCDAEVHFAINFDPRAANLSLGKVENVLLLNIIGGPLVPVRLVANVTMPDIVTNCEILDFEKVKVGQASLVTIQLYNPTPVVTEWTTVNGDQETTFASNNLKSSQSIISRKNKQKRMPEKKPLIFEMIPTAGELKPGQRLNVQIKFMPLESKSYSSRLVMRLSQSSKRIVVKCVGLGLEPALEFTDSFIQFEPVLPYSVGCEKIITVHNPCTFPIEFYSLEFDKTYLEDEKILRHISGYDEFGNMLIPPRNANDKLPEEFINYYNEKYNKTQNGDSNNLTKSEIPEESEIEKISSRKAGDEKGIDVGDGEDKIQTGPGKSSMSYNDSESTALDDLEQTPVSQAIAKYLGIELTPEGKAARRNRGIAIVVIGNPISGKTDTATKLAKKYSAALLTIDGVITEAINLAATEAANRARTLCIECARRCQVFETDESQEKKYGTDGGVTGAVVNVAATHSLMQATHNRKTSTVSTMARHPSKQSGSNKDHPLEKQELNTYLLCSSPPPLAGPTPTKLNVTILDNDDTLPLMSCILPDDLIIQLLSERLMMSDCHKGVVFDGLESLFAQSQSCVAQIILHALNNRRYLYFVTLKRDFKSIKEEEKEAEERDALLKEKQEEAELTWMMEMTEEEYEALDEDTKMRLEEKRLRARREKKKKELEEKERERIEKEEYEAEMQKQKDDKSSKKNVGKKGQLVDDKAKFKSGKETAMGKVTRENTAMNKEVSVALSDKHVTDRPESHMTVLSAEGDDRKKKQKVLEKKSVGKIDELPKEGQEIVEEICRDPKKEQEWLLHQKFTTFDNDYKQIVEILAQWDRAHPPMKSGQSQVEGLENVNEENITVRKGAKTVVGNKKLKDHISTHTQHATAFSHSPNHDDVVDVTIESPQNDPIDVPNLQIDVSKKSISDRNNLITTETETKLPSVEEVLEGLGMGPKGPPIPPPAIFSIVQFPMKRSAPNIPEIIGENGLFNFLGTKEDKEDEKKDTLEKDEEKVKEDGLPGTSPSKSNRGKKADGKDRTSNIKGSAKKSTARRSSLSYTSPISAPTPISDDGINDNDASSNQSPTYRWVIQPNSEVHLRLRFKSDIIGQFDQAFNFELLDTRRKYQVFCRGICSFPNISKEPRIVFPHRQRNKEQQEIVHKKYIIDNSVFEFGPLLIHKDKQRVMENKFPENVEQIIIKNTSPLVSDINFSFLNDVKSERFALDPPTMILQPDQSNTLTVWAFPRFAQTFDDAIVCCIKENPEPVIFNVSCQGVLPFVELDRKVLQFSKVLLHRKDMKCIFMKNNTALPVSWQITGLESLGEEFSIAQDSGVIAPLTEFKLDAYFRAMKPYKANQKKNIRLEISDVERIAGILQTETIQVFAEAYDVALDMSFPKGATNGLDMGVVKVGEEVKQSITIKNRGPYEIKYRFELENGDKKRYEYASMFTLTPTHGSLQSGDKALQVLITYCAKEEVFVKDEQILKCHIIEPNGEDKGEEVVATIPIRISAKSVFSKYQITPKADINFGAVVVQTRKTRQITIENLGEFDFKFHIQKSQKGAQGNPVNKESVQPKDSVGAGLSKMKPADNLLIGGSQARLQAGNFILFPTMGVLPSKGTIVITVDCISESPGRSDENIVIDITDRNPRQDINGIQYKLFVEAFVPNIDYGNFASIFEEHRICETLGFINKDVYQSCSGGIYGINENRFVFTNVLVGSKVESRFRLDNPCKVPCDISLSIKAVHGGRTSVGGRGSASIADVFEVEPTRAQIEPRGALYVRIIFSPQSMQQYTANFECNIEGLTASSTYKSKSLCFEVSGEGYLPRVTVTKPTLRNKKGQFLCLFKRSLLHKIQKQKLELSNEGSLPCRIHVDVIDPDSAFRVSMGDNELQEYSQSPTRKPHDLVLNMDVGSTASIDVFFCPTLSGRYCANIKITIVNNQYEDTIIQLIGEGYEDFICFDNLPLIEIKTATVVKAQIPPSSSKNAVQPPQEDIIDASKNNVLNFGDCYINTSKMVSFSLVNHSTDHSVKFCWPSSEGSTSNQANTVPVKFSPSMGHLHPGQSINIMVTIQPIQPKSWTEKAVQCKIVKINLIDLEPGQKPMNWDDSKKTMKWVDTATDGTMLTSARKKKIIETEPEPKCVEVIETARSLDLFVTANADYAKFKCKTTEIHFQDTMLFENRTYGFNLKNEGSVNMRYQLHVTLDEYELFSPRSSRPATARVTNIEDGDDAQCKNPFLVEPSSGIVIPGDKQQIKVLFSPLLISYFRATLTCHIDNTDPSAIKPTITLTGRSLQPNCHFELVDSDYLISGRRDPTMRGPGGSPAGTGLNVNTRVVEVSVIGLTSRETRRFGVVNPTKTDFSFQWICEDVPGLKSQSPFQCLITNGIIESGKKSQCAFQFSSQMVGVTESFWRFEIQEIGISVPFLFVGQCMEPNVTFNKSHFKFPALLVGHESIESIDLINFDNQPYNYSFQEISRHAPGHTNSLRIEPMSGVIPANTTIPVHVGFLANNNQILNFNLVCKVDKKTYPLTLNVKAEGYSVDSTVWIETDNSHSTEMIPLSKSGDADLCNFLDLGRSEIGEELTKFITLANDGRFNYDFHWDLKWRDDPKLSAMLHMKPLSGTVTVGQKLRCEVYLNANRHISFDKVQALLSVNYGPSYLLNITAEIRKPLVSFSFEKYNFGHCFVYRAGMERLTTQLVIQNRNSKNSDQRPVSIECLTESNDVIIHNFDASVLAPGQSATIDITFLPRKPMKYSNVLVFELNGMSRQSIELTGICEELKIEALGLTTNHTINLGMLKVGGKESKTVAVVNKTHVPVLAKFVFSPSNECLQQRGVMKITPLAQEITIQPNKSNAITMEITFSPNSRIPKFTEEIYCECMGVSMPLFMITGGCNAHDIQLDLESISFGLVTKGSQLVKRLSMNNNGDIGARFKWNAEAFKPDFAISPTSGYISPGMEVVFEVTFRPTKPCTDIRNENIECTIEGWNNLALTLTGVCQLVTPVKETLNFSCIVRQQDTKSVKINNSTNANWFLKPVFEGDHWSGAETFVVEPQQIKTYEITFHPLTMPQEGKKHQGSVFFAIPDGTGLLFNLTGNAEPPKAVAKINRELPARTSYTELLEVTNWLKRPQRFKVNKEIIKSEKADSSVELKGFDYIDVPGGSSKQYKLSFKIQKESLTQMKVIFTNESTNEYQFYELQVKAFKAASTAKIHLTSPVRQCMQHAIPLDNNTAQPITYQITCLSADIRCMPQFIVQPHSSIPFTFEFCPLRIGDSVAKLEISSVETGAINYDLELVGTAAREEQPLIFQTSIGTSQTLLAHFKNWTKNKVDFACKIDNAKFTSDKSITVAPNVDAQLEVHFEPSKLGEARATLNISNAVAGEFVFPLIGTPLLPKPQGPFAIKVGSSVSLNFRNVFADSVQFYFQVDNPAFHVNKNSENIKSKKDHRIVVGFDGSVDGGPVMGKLSVTCPDMDMASSGTLSKLQWVYYLKGLQRD